MILKITNTCVFSALEKDVILVKIIEFAEIEVKDVLENFNATMEITNGSRYAVLVDARVVVTIDAEARALSAKKEFQANLIAQAIVVNSLANRLIGNFIIKFNKPYSPTKLFSEEKVAMIWLRKHIAKDKLKKSKSKLILV